jgi:hypothetical protein
MAKTITKDITGINEAGKLLLNLIDYNQYWRLRADPTKCAEAPKELVRNVERLDVLLKKPNVGGALSLATPFPVRIGFFWSVSYAQCICDMFKSKLGGSCWSGDKLPEDNSEFLYHCIKELERATETPCTADFLETIKPRPGRHSKRNIFIWKLDEDGYKPKEIENELKGKVPLYGKAICLTRILQILKEPRIYKNVNSTKRSLKL